MSNCSTEITGSTRVPLSQYEDNSLFSQNGSSPPAATGGPIITHEQPTDVANELPTIGSTFMNLSSLVETYQQYAITKGFAVMKKFNRVIKDGRSVTISCDRGGRRVAKSRGTKQIGCDAKIIAHVRDDDGSCIVKNVVCDHNHNLEPGHSMYMPGNRSVSNSKKRSFIVNDVCAVRPCKSIRQVEVQCGGPQLMSCSTKDCLNFIDKTRRESTVLGDAATMSDMFENVPDNDMSYYRRLKLDSDNRLCHVFWIDPRARLAYKEFHDVITFDTTYKVNRYDMPFASFVGVNHHGQYILLGCALLSDETADTYKWLFRTWLSAMDGVQPGLIITDQDEAMKIAISEVIPDCRHKLCCWHIMRKQAAKFAGVEDPKTAAIDFKETIYENVTIGEFEENWKKFITKHSLRENPWLIKMYSLRESWVLVYLKHIFCAGMISTQRSESMHSFFDGFINRQSSLSEFVEKYEMVVASKTHKEIQEDCDSQNKVPHLMFPHPFEVKFRDVFTNRMFRLVQKEIGRMANCHILCHSTSSDENGNPTRAIEESRVMESYMLSGFIPKHVVHTVTYRKVGNYFECSCKKFQSHMLLCCHIFEVAKVHGVMELNDRYLPRRWRKDVVFQHSKIFFRGAYPTMPQHIRNYKELEFLFNELADLALHKVKKVELIKDGFRQIKEALTGMIDDLDDPDEQAQSARIDGEGTRSFSDIGV